MTASPTLVVRRARRSEEEALIDFLIRGRAHISGSRRRVVFRALLRDSYGPSPITTIAVGDVDGQLAAALVAVNGDLPRYYQRLPFHHPIAAAALFLHRVRKLPGRITGRRHARAADAGRVDAPHAKTPEVLVGDPRLQQPPRPADGPGPHASDHGPEISFCITLMVGPEHRGLGLSKQMVVGATRHLAAIGATRYDCSFSPADVVASKLYLSLPFDIQRYPSGYFASLDLTDVAHEELPA